MAVARANAVEMRESMITHLGRMIIQRIEQIYPETINNVRLSADIGNGVLPSIFSAGPI